MAKTGFRVVFKPGTWDWLIPGKKQPGLNLERALIDFVLVKGLATNSSGDCCTLEPAQVTDLTSTTVGFRVPRMTSTQVTAWEGTFVDEDAGIRDGELVFDITNQTYVSATWDGSDWVFQTLAFTA